MEPYEIVKTIMITFAVTYFILEIILNLNDIDNDTSNAILLQWSKEKMFFIPFALGSVIGHLFLGTKNDAFEMGSMYPVITLFGLIVISVIIGFLVSFKKSKLFLSTLLFFGVLYGHFFWSMNYQPN